MKRQYRKFAPSSVIIVLCLLALGCCGCNNDNVSRPGSELGSSEDSMALGNTPDGSKITAEESGMAGSVADATHSSISIATDKIVFDIGFVEGKRNSAGDVSLLKAKYKDLELVDSVSYNGITSNETWQSKATGLEYSVAYYSDHSERNNFITKIYGKASDLFIGLKKPITVKELMDILEIPEEEWIVIGREETYTNPDFDVHEFEGKYSVWYSVDEWSYIESQNAKMDDVFLIINKPVTEKTPADYGMTISSKASGFISPDDEVTLDMAWGY